MTITTEARNATLADLAELLQSQQAAKLDIVAPATTLRSIGGLLHVRDADVSLTEDGVNTRAGVFRPTAVFDEGVADKLGIPLAYVRKMRAERPDLYDANVNGWLHGRSVLRIVEPDRSKAHREVLAEPDARSFLLRTFRGEEDEPGIARAMLSDSYGGVADNFDALTAALDGVRQSGVDIEVESCNLTERRMYVAISAPSVAALAPDLLRGYRSPYTNNSGDENPTVFAGFILANSETGNGAFSITPRLVVQVCKNGMTVTKDAMRSIHLGGKLDSGVIRWSADTQEKNLAVITAKARDAVATFLDVDYVRSVIAATEAVAAKPIADIDATIKIVAKKLSFTEAETKGVLDHFIRGGQVTAGGVLQAVTSYCQTIENADDAFVMEAKALQAMEYAYAAA